MPGPNVSVKRISLFIGEVTDWTGVLLKLSYPECPTWDSLHIQKTWNSRHLKKSKGVHSLSPRILRTGER